MGAQVNTTAAAPAGIIYDRNASIHPYGVYKADAIRADTATDTSVGNLHRDTGHPCDFVSDFGRDIRQDSPETATGTTVTDREQLMTGADMKPDRIELVSPDHMNQTHLPAPHGVIEGLLPADGTAETGVYSSGSVTQKKASQIDGIVLTV